MIRLVIAFIGTCIICTGVITLFSPIPIGIILIAIGSSMLVCVSPKSRTILKHFRQKYRALDAGVLALETRLNNRFQLLSEALLETRPAPTEDKNFFNNKR